MWGFLTAPRVSTPDLCGVHWSTVYFNVFNICSIIGWFAYFQSFVIITRLCTYIFLAFVILVLISLRQIFRSVHKYIYIGIYIYYYIYNIIYIIIIIYNIYILYIIIIIIYIILYII